MATTDQEARATQLAKEAVELVTAGKTEDGSRALREAVSLAPDNKEVKAAFIKIQSDATVQPLLSLLQTFVQKKDVLAGKEALQYLQSYGSEVSITAAGSCLDLVVNYETTLDAKLQDRLLASILQHCLPARVYLAKKIQDSITAIFNRIYDIGDGSANSLSTLMLEPAAWPSEQVRKAYERDVFQLFVAKLLESGHDHDGRALRGISKLLAVNADELHTLLDDASFDAILVCLDNRLPLEVRSQATLATAKYLEASKETGQWHLQTFANDRMIRNKNTDLIVVFSVAAAVFPLVPSVASALFLTEGFLPSLVPTLDKRARPKIVEAAALDMLSASCIDSVCREAIAKYCLGWMHHVMNSEEDERAGQAAVILAKVQGTGTSKEQQSMTEQVTIDIVPMLKGMLLTGEEPNKRNSIEGLAYASIQPKVKEAVANDAALLKQLFEPSVKHSTTAGEIFGSLTLIDNVARYPPNLSEEQKRMSQLKAYANASKDGAKSDPLDDEEHVAERCQALIDAGVLPYLVRLKQDSVSNILSAASLSLIARILLSLSKTPGSRGKIAQQGAIPLLLKVCNNTATDIQSQHVAAHAIARILISVDPKLISGHVMSAIPPILSLLKEEGSDNSDGPRDLLPVFEALLAMTNLVSDPSLNAGAEVVRTAFPKIEDLLLSNNSLVQRATTELVCNLMTCPSGIEQFADGSKPAGRRLHILLALADVEDEATRRASGGALATITEFEDAVKAILERERGLEILLGLCQDDDQGCIHRGVVCVRNIALAEGETGKKARDRLKVLDAVKVLKEVLKGSRDNAVLETGVEALKALLA